MRSIYDFDFNGKRALVRCDFNVPIVNNQVVDDFKILQSLETIRYLKSRGAKVILMSHLSVSEDELSGGVHNKLSLAPVAEKLSLLLKEKVGFIKKCSSKSVEKKIAKLRSGEIVLLENLRTEEGEEKNSQSFATLLARLGDVYVNEAFSVCHREHASVVALPSIMKEKFAGLNLEKEILALNRVLKPERPLVVIIGGAKLNSKIKMIGKFLDKADFVLVGGKLVAPILAVKGVCLSKAWPDKDVSDMIAELNLTNPKLKLPVDGLLSPTSTGEVYVREGAVGTLRGNEGFFDIGPSTIKIFREIILSSKVVFWAGPLGLSESPRFCEGTRKVGEAILENKDIFSVVGGGDTISSLKNLNLLNGFSYVSTGGGAMLAFLAGEKLPGLEALENN